MANAVTDDCDHDGEGKTVLWYMLGENESIRHTSFLTEFVVQGSNFELSYCDILYKSITRRVLWMGWRIQH